VTIVHGYVQRGDSELCERNSAFEATRGGLGPKMKVKRQSEISSASLAGTATNNSETPTHLGAVTPGVQPYQGSWREGSVRGMREESREIGVQSHAGGFNGVVVTGVSAHSAEGGTSDAQDSSSLLVSAASYSFSPSSEPDMVVLLHFRLLCVVG